MPHRRDRRHRVRVIRRAHDHRVERLFLVEHLAEIAIVRRLRIRLERLARPLIIHVGDRHDPLRLHALQIVPAAPSGADDANRQLFAFAATCRVAAAALRSGPG